MVSSVRFEEATSAYELEVVVWEDVAEVESSFSRFSILETTISQSLSILLNLFCSWIHTQRWHKEEIVGLTVDEGD